MEKEIALACDHCAAIQEIGRVHEVASQLHALLLRLNNHYVVNFKAAEHDNSSCKSWQEVAGEKVQEILKLNSSTLPRLQSIVNGCCCCSNGSGEHKRKKRLEIATDSQKIRRRKEETWSAVTTEPYHDGHQWRKYGKKTINNAKYQRSYYRCIHKEEGCLAKKTIQQIEEDGMDDGETAASRFSVEYICRHTCKLSTAADEVLLEPFVMESTAPISSHSRISTAAGSSGSNSTACCSSSSKLEDDAFVASLLIDQMGTVGEDGHDMEDYRKVFSPIYEGCGWDWEYTDNYIPLGNEYYIW
ncbi:probable WRKY transcription factor 54 [Zingiber officinale]|uniref:probable WRKY transcription factor 54 n=1 Tax=Zingiber officinale TaxID=94328 RepID=UPI001C4A9A5A|nr:probable WRKY transcription factor 54 [Zingiber officinale]